MTTAMMNWLSPNVMHSLGWALLHFLWQGTALAALAAVAMALCRRTSARYLVGVAALGLMLLAPLATLSYYAQQNTGSSGITKASPLVSMAWPIARNNSTARTATITLRNAPTRDGIPWLVEAWLFGVAFFSLRSAGGFLLLERERRRQSSVVSARVLQICYTLQDQLGITHAIRYCECKWLQAPAVIGWFRPIIFLPVTALTGLSEDQLQAVIAHELAHIRRFDPFVNVFQVCVETLLFYHPAVWWLNKRIRAEREHCCDEVAVAVCGNAVEYARALTLMEEWRSAPVFAMAANRGPLAERIVRVLGLKTLGAGMRGIGLTGSLLCLTAALLAGNTLLEMAHPTSARAGSRMQAESTTSSATSAQPATKSIANPKPSPARAQGSAPTSANSSSYIDGLNSVGLSNLSIDTLIALKTQDVTPEYVRGLQEQGLHPDAEKLIGMRVQGITPEYVRDLHAAGLTPSEDQLIALKVQGADGEYYRGLKEAGITPDAEHLIALKVQGVTPEYVRELRGAGLATTVDQVIAMKVQDVTPAYLKGMHDQGVDVRAEDAIAMRVQDVTPEYVREMQGLGLKPSANELIAMRVQEVSPEYVREIQALGLKPSVNEFVAMRVQDVTPEYVKALQSAGFKLGIDDIIGAKVQDVTPEFIERAKQHGFKDLSLQKLIQLRQLGILDSKADL